MIGIKNSQTASQGKNTSRQALEQTQTGLLGVVANSFVVLGFWQGTATFCVARSQACTFLSESQLSSKSTVCRLLAVACHHAHTLLVLLALLAKDSFKKQVNNRTTHARTMHYRRYRFGDVCLVPSIHPSVPEHSVPTRNWAEAPSRNCSKLLLRQVEHGYVRHLLEVLAKDSHVLRSKEGARPAPSCRCHS